MRTNTDCFRPYGSATEGAVKNFTSKGKPTTGYFKQLVHVEKFTWDNKTAEREWADMTAEQRCAYAGIES